MNCSMQSVTFIDARRGYAITVKNLWATCDLRGLYLNHEDHAACIDLKESSSAHWPFCPSGCPWHPHGLIGCQASPKPDLHAGSSQNPTQSGTDRIGESQRKLRPHGVEMSSEVFVKASFIKEHYRYTDKLNIYPSLFFSSWCQAAHGAFSELICRRSTGRVKKKRKLIHLVSEQIGWIQTRI